MYPSFVGENSGSDFPFFAPVSLLFVWALQVRVIDSWCADDPANPIDRKQIDNRGWLNFLHAVIGWLNGYNYYGSQ